MKNKVNIYLDYQEDFRKSMDIYGEQLYKALKNNNLIDMELYRPQKTLWNKCIPEKYSFKNRASRYLDYPAKLALRRKEFSHIIDQSYAHLVMALNPEKCIVTVHDLIPMLAWSGRIPGFKLGHRPLLFEYSASFLKKFKKIIAISYSTKSNIQQLLDIPDEKIEVIYNGVDEIFRPLGPNERGQFLTLTIPKNVFKVLIIGNAEYKNNKSSLAAVELLESKFGLALQLVCLGADSVKFFKECENYKIARKPIFLMNMSLAQLVELYNFCDCLLFPSLYEGFGVPPLEAMACGLPVVSSNAGSLIEVVGNAALITEPMNIEGLATNLLRVLTEPIERERLISLGYIRSKLFTWNSTANKTFKLYREEWGI